MAVDEAGPVQLREDGPGSLVAALVRRGQELTAAVVRRGSRS